MDDFRIYIEFYIFFNHFYHHYQSIHSFILFVRQVETLVSFLLQNIFCQSISSFIHTSSFKQFFKQLLIDFSHHIDHQFPLNSCDFFLFISFLHRIILIIIVLIIIINVLCIKGKSTISLLLPFHIFPLLLYV